MNLKKGRIAVLAGGPSCEREISLISGQAVTEALKALGFSAVMLDPVDGFLDVLRREKIRVAFLALHGTFGEDGTVQKLLDRAGILYTGSSAAVSEMAFDKARSQVLFRKEGLRVPDHVFFKKGGRVTAEAILSWPCVVKPASSGSSVGVSLVPHKSGLEKAVFEAFDYSDTVIVESYIRGRELTVGILEEKPLPIVEIVAQREFYDYQAKYKDTGTRYLSPALLEPDLALEVTETALKAHRVLGCRGVSRVDIILGEDHKPYVLEVNTIPGLTPKSLLPKAARAAGIDFPALCVRILQA
ncbi:MAG: D-alanine--D-alanine ligase [Candidatus Omnitrophica bacterium]|nr:D-alanine--D-alanine ligase [Candidatus Omnitrophota bacterium]